MKRIKPLGVVAIMALALMAFTGTASATTIEVKGVPQNAAVTLHAVGFSSILLTDTSGSFANTCKKSTVHLITTSPFSITILNGNVLVLNFEECTEDAKEKVVVDAAGTLGVENISGTTNGTVTSKSAKVTTPSPFGKLTCTTSSTGTDIGKLTGVKEGTATMDISAVLNCGLITAKWSGTYSLTTSNIGVTA